MGERYTDILETNELSLLDTLDHVLNRGLVISGDITISVADIDLIYLGLNVVLGSVDTINQALGRGADSANDDGPVEDSIGHRSSRGEI